MGKIVRRVLLLVFLMLSAVCGVVDGPALAAEVFLGITRSEADRVPASLIRVDAPLTLTGQAGEVRAVLEADLRRSLVFRIVDPPSMSGVLTVKDLQPVLIKKIGAHGIGAVIWMALDARGGGVVLEGRVYDGGSGSLIIGKRYIGETKILRMMVHRFSDEVVFRYTGERGIAETRIAYISKLTGAKELYLMDYDGFNPRRLTKDRSLNLSPEWSPDGRWITYTSYRDGNPDIFTLDLGTGQRWKIVDFPALNISPSWSPSGSHLAFASTQGGNLQLYLINRDGADLKQLTIGLGDSLSPSWSSTGQELAFVSNRGGTPQIYIIGRDGTNLRRLTFNGRYNTSPAWSPKKNWIAYTCQIERLMRICLITPDGTRQVQLTDGAGGQEDPAWSPDSRYLVFRSTQDSRGGDLYLMNVEAKEMERLTFNGAQNGSPVWSH